ncbi:hypothetical protein PGT21_030590 [Puccinia graminis f. sp. tritici]|uniref:OTU domain-containing protein n=1 Tax=Puccinia graminis f. sp. tritici TaxID=56615 RepID=A0A5B0PEY0_PUCGR|nr:hypothetical protein PGT21_030590 [Puccinia graminis f. sp. tritici]
MEQEKIIKLKRCGPIEWLTTPANYHGPRQPNNYGQPPANNYGQPQTISYQPAPPPPNNYGPQPPNGNGPPPAINYGNPPFNYYGSPLTDNDHQPLPNTYGLEQTGNYVTNIYGVLPPNNIFQPIFDPIQDPGNNYHIASGNNYSVQPVSNHRAPSVLIQPSQPTNMNTTRVSDNVHNPHPNQDHAHRTNDYNYAATPGSADPHASGHLSYLAPAAQGHLIPPGGLIANSNNNQNGNFGSSEQFTRRHGSLPCFLWTRPVTHWCLKTVSIQATNFMSSNQVLQPTILMILDVEVNVVMDEQGDQGGLAEVSEHHEAQSSEAPGSGVPTGNPATQPKGEIEQDPKTVVLTRVKVEKFDYSIGAPMDDPPLYRCGVLNGTGPLKVEFQISILNLSISSRLKISNISPRIPSSQSNTSLSTLIIDTSINNFINNNHQNLQPLYVSVESFILNHPLSRYKNCQAKLGGLVQKGFTTTFESYTGSYKASMGIPCWHMLAEILERGDEVQVSDFHPQWSLQYNPDNPDEEEPYDFNKDYDEMLKAEILALHRPVTLPGLMKTFRQVLYNTHVVPIAPDIEPIHKSTRKGSKKRKKLGRGQVAKRDPIYAEVVDEEIDKAQKTKKQATRKIAAHTKLKAARAILKGRELKAKGKDGTGARPPATVLGKRKQAVRLSRYSSEGNNTSSDSSSDSEEESDEEVTTSKAYEESTSADARGNVDMTPSEYAVLDYPLVPNTADPEGNIGPIPTVPGVLHNPHLTTMGPQAEPPQGLVGMTPMVPAGPQLKIAQTEVEHPNIVQAEGEDPTGSAPPAASELKRPVKQKWVPKRVGVLKPTIPVLPLCISNYVQLTYDPPGNGNCGYWCVAHHLEVVYPNGPYGKPDGWHQVRTELLDELNSNKPLWSGMLGGDTAVWNYSWEE